MREIKAFDIGEQLLAMLKEEHPIEEDIGIVDHSGEIMGVFIPPKAYDFFLKKIAEEEDRLDKESLKELCEPQE